VKTRDGAEDMAILQVRQFAERLGGAPRARPPASRAGFASTSPPHPPVRPTPPPRQLAPPVGAAGELAAPAGEVERWRRSRRAKRAAEREARGVPKPRLPKPREGAPAPCVHPAPRARPPASRAGFASCATGGPPSPSPGARGGRRGFAALGRGAWGASWRGAPRPPSQGREAPPAAPRPGAGGGGTAGGARLRGRWRGGGEAGARSGRPSARRGVHARGGGTFPGLREPAP
jgi:translation initiation factor IF-2